MTVRAFTFAQRPELWDGLEDLSRDVWPEYNRHGDVLNRYWSRLYDELPGFQAVLVDDDDTVLAEVHSAPCRWDGTAGGLPAGIDGAIAAAFERGDGEPDTLCALAVEVVPVTQGRGVSSHALRTFRSLATGAGLGAVIVPVRPSLKERYPLVAIERYASWRRDDGLPFDPWLRTHERAGGRIVRPEPHSLRITGTVAQWESWTGMAFPDDGDYVFPHGLAPVSIDRGADRGSYWEPNVWVVHDGASADAGGAH